MSQFQTAVQTVLEYEGGLSEDEADPGGITNFGISFRFLKEVETDALRKYGIIPEVTEDTIRDLTEGQAIEIYKGEFWDNFRFEEIKDQLLANYIFDTAINPNPATAFRMLQRSLWAFGGYEKCKVDGIMGSKTLELTNKYGYYLIHPLIAERAAWYRQHSNPKYLEGHLKRAYRQPFSSIQGK